MVSPVGMKGSFLAPSTVKRSLREAKFLRLRSVVDRFLGPFLDAPAELLGGYTERPGKLRELACAEEQHEHHEDDYQFLTSGQCNLLRGSAYPIHASWPWGGAEGRAVPPGPLGRDQHDL